MAGWSAPCALGDVTAGAGLGAATSLRRWSTCKAIVTIVGSTQTRVSNLPPFTPPVPSKHLLTTPPRARRRGL